MNPLFISDPVELAMIVAIALLLFGYKLVSWLGRRTGKVTERIRHVDEDFQTGREE